MKKLILLLVAAVLGVGCYFIAVEMGFFRPKPRISTAPSVSNSPDDFHGGLSEEFFDGPSIKPDWQWAGKVDYASLTDKPGWLTIRPSTAVPDDSSNVLQHAVPAGDFTIETRMQSNGENYLTGTKLGFRFHSGQRWIEPVRFRNNVEFADGRTNKGNWEWSGRADQYPIYQDGPLTFRVVRSSAVG